MSSDGIRRRVVVDLNLFISGLISRSGLPNRLLVALEARQFTLVWCPQLRDDLDGVLQREKFITRFRISAAARADLLLLIDTAAEMVTPWQTVPVSVRDPDDEIVLATALAGNADFLVTGDEDLLVLDGNAAIGSLRIVTVRAFLQALGESGSGRS